MKFCTTCGTIVRRNQDRCSECGTIIERGKKPVVAATKEGNRRPEKPLPLNVQPTLNGRTTVSGIADTYRSMTDEEIVRLHGEVYSLTVEAREALLAEIQQRGLTDNRIADNQAQSVLPTRMADSNFAAFTAFFLFPFEKILWSVCLVLWLAGGLPFRFEIMHHSYLWVPYPCRPILATGACPSAAEGWAQSSLAILVPCAPAAVRSTRTRFRPRLRSR